MRSVNEDKTAGDNLSQSSTITTCFLPWPHQEEALAQLEQAAQIEDRMTMVLACGSGKTILALWFAERLQYQRILILLPSLGLLSQTLHEWLRLTQWQSVSYLCVCCDAGVVREEDTFFPNQSELDFTVTTSAEAVQQFLAAPFSTDVQLVFSTYQSAPVVAAAMDVKQPFDLAIFDEAHKTAGLAHHLFAFALEDSRLPCKKRLFMTATPRHCTLRNPENNPQLVYSMDSAELYGATHYHLPFAEAVERDIICDYQVIIPVVTSHQVNALALHHSNSLIKGKPIPAETLAHYIALREAVQKQGIQKILTFHNRVQKAKHFKNIGKKMGEQLLPGFQFFHINGKMSAEKRERILQAFARAPAALLTNARCLTEGIDIPNVDLVAFFSPKHSAVDIVQAAGRVMRKAPGKKQGYVLVPLYAELSHQETLEEAVLRLDYGDIWEILYALAEHDDILASSVCQASHELGQKGEISLSTLAHKILITTPLINAELLKQSIVTLCLDKLHNYWDKRYGELLAFKERMGHCNVPSRCAENRNLGVWVRDLRKYYKEKKLSEAKIAKLNAIGFQWTIQVDWQQRYNELLAFKKEHNHLHIPYQSNKVLSHWVRLQRRRYKQGRLSKEQICKLNGLGFKWKIKCMSWQQSYNELVAFKKKHNGNLPSTCSNKALANWVKNQRSEYWRGKLNPMRVAQLEKLGLNLKQDSLRKLNWQKRYQELVAYQQTFGDCRVPYEWAKNPSLSYWISTQRAGYRKGTISQERIDLLNAIGFEWPVKKCE